jgi:hypothetical protein
LAGKRIFTYTFYVTEYIKHLKKKMSTDNLSLAKYRPIMAK